tara:strand:- start:189 stop:1289 length:1101 start_codon:yes stop_codon:yes gene_type:complete
MTHLFSHFPREIDMKARKVIRSMNQLQHYVKKTNGRDNLTTTVYGFRELKTKGNRCEYSTAIIPHFVVDLDKGRANEILHMDEEAAGQRCTDDTLILVKYLEEREIRHATWMSGGGYHVWIMLDQVYDLDPKDTHDLLFSGRAMINKWINDMDLVTIDPVVSFRPDRHIRIPNTFNTKRSLWSIPVDQQDLANGWDYISEKAKNPSGGMKARGKNGLKIEIVKSDPGNQYMSGMTGFFGKFEAAEITVNSRNISGIPMLPCLDAACCTKGDNPPHLPRSYLSMYLLDYFHSFARPRSSSKVTPQEAVSKAHAFIRDLEWADYNPKITQEQLVHASNREYMTPTCPTIFRQGLCIGKCPFYDQKGVE